MPVAPRLGTPPRGARLRRAVGAVVAVVALAGVAACSGDPEPTRTTEVIVAIGDSYSVGYAPVGEGTTTMATSDASFPNDLARLLSTDRTKVVVENFGCAGATSQDLIERTGCDRDRQAPGAPVYADVTQADAAEVFLQANQGRVAALTIVIGGNDVTGCIDLTPAGVANDPSGCIYQRLLALRDRLDVLLPRLRTAAGPDVPIVGLTYPDIYLGLWLQGPGGQELARQSLQLFRDELNPLLAERYADVGARFVDLTDEFGGAEPLTTTTESDYGTLPVAVAQVCEFTFACSNNDTHPTPEGHQRIAEAIRDALAEPVPTPTSATGSPTS